MPKPLTKKIKSDQAFGYYNANGTLIKTSLTKNELRKILPGLKGSKISKPNTKTIIDEVYSDRLTTKNQEKPSKDPNPVYFDEIVSADQTNISFLSRGLYPSSNSLARGKKCDYGLRNNTFAPRIAELIRRTIKENLINYLPPEIRILPMTINSATHKDCHSVKDLQDKFFLGLLPSRERNGRYLYTRKKINSKPGAVILFQAKSSIIASAEFIGIQPLEKSVEGYNGYMVFDVNSIQVFDPIYQDEMRECWPKFNKFSQAFQKLDPGGYPKFLKMLNGVKTSQEYYFTEEAVDISNPPEKVESIIFRILRDTELARLVKRIHNYECQICGHTIVLSDGRRYAESHHIQPLGKPHSGPDIKSNIICVCPNHHAELDYGAKPIEMKSLRIAKSHKIDSKFIEYHNKKIFFSRCCSERNAIRTLDL